MVEVIICNERTEDSKEEMRTDGNGHTAENVAPESVIFETKEDLEVQTQKTSSWIWSVVYLCFYGFMVQLKPGEPFITPYLLSTEKNFTRNQVWCYSTFILILYSKFILSLLKNKTKQKNT